MKYRLRYYFPADEELPLSDWQSFEFEVDSEEKANAVSDLLQLHGIRVGELFRAEESGEVLINDEKGLKGNVIIFDQRDLIRRISEIKDWVGSVMVGMRNRLRNSPELVSKYDFYGYTGTLGSAIEKLESLEQQISAKEPQTKPA